MEVSVEGKVVFWRMSLVLLLAGFLSRVVDASAGVWLVGCACRLLGETRLCRGHVRVLIIRVTACEGSG